MRGCPKHRMFALAYLVTMTRRRSGTNGSRGELALRGLGPLCTPMTQRCTECIPPLPLCRAPTLLPEHLRASRASVPAVPNAEIWSPKSTCDLSLPQPGETQRYGAPPAETVRAAPGSHLGLQVLSFDADAFTWAWWSHRCPRGHDGKNCKTHG